MSRSIVGLALRTAEEHPDRPALLDGRGGPYARVTYRRLVELVEQAAHGLAALGVSAGDKVAILSGNRPEWPIADLAVFAVRGVSVPVHTNLSSSQTASILRDAGVKALFVEDAEAYAKAREHPVDRVVAFDAADGLTPFGSLLERGRARRGGRPAFLRESVEAIDPDATCSLVYSSGTTGEPKGVMLHHRGFVHDVVESEAVFALRPEDVFLSFLPLSHLFERVAGHWCPFYRGAAVAYAESVATVARDLQTVRPTVMVSVPRVFEKLRGSVLRKVEDAPSSRRRLFEWAARIGREHHDLRLDGGRDLALSARYLVADLLVLRKIRDALGGRFRFPISGGAPLSTDTLRFFGALGIDVIEGYGMTETHLVIALTPPGRTRIGSCGRPLSGVEVKIAEDGEILVRGPTVMAGYHGREDLTRAAIDGEGWLHTGDIGRLDEDAFLYITDRKKNLIVTSGGKNVVPAPIENDIRASRYVDDVCLIGDRRKFLSAVIVPAWDEVMRWAKENGLGGLDRAALARHPALVELMLTEIRARQASHADYEKVRKCLVLHEPLSVERGELTPTLKMRRRVIEERFAAEIDALY
jgi:long-chain acyl-CoA synthetase